MQLARHFFPLLGIFSVTKSLSNATKLETNGERVKLLEPWQFQCQNGQSIAKTLVCNGLKDCKDGSDETYDQCQIKSSGKCDERHFQCQYGACIEKKYQCDGLEQCIDGSDEWPDICNVVKEKYTKPRTKRNADTSCAVPVTSSHTTFKLLQCKGNCSPSQKYVDELTSAEVTCEPDYSIFSKDQINNTSTHLCHNRQWIPPITECAKCGKPYKNSVPLISYGVTETIGGSPWHVAIYDEKKELICSGTIITEHLVVTAAHCFHWGRHCDGYECTPNYCNGTKCAGSFEVVVGKYHRNYTTYDPFQKTMKIEEIRFYDTGYWGFGNQHMADIALLILQYAIPLSPQVMPACFNWAGLNGKYPVEGKLGKVVGWGATENGTFGTILMSTELPYISYHRCREMLPKDLENRLTFDKFCAGKENLPDVGPQKGDSGGGILFKYKDLYYLQGVVSVKPNDESFLRLFTDLYHYITWILSVRNEVETKMRSPRVNLRG